MELQANEINLPKNLGDWARPDSPRVIHSKNIFDYMNGAGELYLSYRFRHLEVYDYRFEKQNNILVELYFMETSDDAFGLLSLDWGGEPVAVSESLLKTPPRSMIVSPKALYGAGLLRIWSDTLYARVMAYRETPASKQAVLALGKTIALNRRNHPAPEILKILPRQIGSAWKLREDRLSFFRSYLVMNSIYFLSQENILDLDLSTEAVIGPYERISKTGDQKRCQFLLVKYENHDRARKALNHFHDAYLTEQKKGFPSDAPMKYPSVFKIEDGWVAYQQLGKYIAIVFECPDRESARIIIEKNESNLLEKEGLS